MTTKEKIERLATVLPANLIDEIKTLPAAVKAVWVAEEYHDRFGRKEGELR